MATRSLFSRAATAGLSHIRKLPLAGIRIAQPAAIPITHKACAAAEAGVPSIARSIASRTSSNPRVPSTIPTMAVQSKLWRSYCASPSKIAKTFLSRASSNPNMSSIPTITIPSKAYYTSHGAHRPRNSGARFLLGLTVTAGSLYILLADSYELDSVPEDLSPDEAVDWVKLGCVPPVVPRYYSARCGCCWIITSVQNAESIMMIQTGKYTQLSVQQLIDCCVNERTGVRYGCSGGFLPTAFTYMQKYGLTSASAYPVYNPDIIKREGPCMAAGKPIALKIDGWEKFSGVDAYVLAGQEPPQSIEQVFKEALKTSPISVSIFANDFFNNVRSYEIIEYDQMPPPRARMAGNHTVLLVGYGCDEAGNKYWIIQNGWGGHWGYNGLARIRRGVKDPRGVGGITAESAWRPIIKND